MNWSAKYLSLLFALLVFASACKKRPVKSTFGEQFELVPGQKVKLSEGKRGDTDLEIKFIEVKEDSRCPLKTECVWPGEAIVVLLLQTNTASGGGVKEVSSSTNGSIPGPVIEFADYSIELLAVTPYPEAGHTIPADDYRVKMQVFLD